MIRPGGGQDAVLRRIDRRHAKAPAGVPGEAEALAQFLAGAGQEPVLLRPAQVGDAKLGGVHLAPGPAHGDDQDLASPATGDQQGLLPVVVDAVDDGVKAPVEEGVGVLGGEEVVHQVQGAVGIDRRDPLRQDLDLGHAEGRRQGDKLAVDVGLGHMIQVHQGQMPQSAARQGLHHPGTDAADADDGDPGLAQTLQPLAAIQGSDAAEAAVNVHWLAGIHAGSWRGFMVAKSSRRLAGVRRLLVVT